MLSAILALTTSFAATVKEVKVKPLDGFGGDLGAVQSRCQTVVGQEYDSVTVTRDINTLKTSNEFEEITADVNEVEDGVEVVFFIKRKVRYLQPLIVQGNDFFSESKIAKESGLKDGFLYGESDLAAAAAKVRLAYQKKYYTDAKVTPKVDVVSANDAMITLLVDEGMRHKVRDVVFDGAEHATETSVINRNANPFHYLDDGCFEAIELHEAVSDYPWWNPVGWFADNPVTSDQRAQCCDKIAEIYRNYGYLDVRVTGPEAKQVDDSGKVDLVFTVEEGPRYHIGEMSISGLTHYSEDQVAKRSELPEIGAVAGAKDIEDAAHRIKVTVGSGELGLADTQVDVKYIPNFNDPTTVDIIFQVTEGVPVVLNEVKIRGNDYTKDKVIRREIKLGPGDPMLEDDAERSQKRLENLDYFSRVRYYLEAANMGKDANGAEYRNLVFEVEEKNTGAFMVGVGASSVDSVYVTAEVNQHNFDIFAPGKMFRGGGQKGRAYVAYGPRYQSAELGVVEPYFLDRQLELSVDLYRRLRWYDQFDLTRSGAEASISYPVKFWPTWNPFGRFGVGVSTEYIQMSDVERGLWWDGSRPVSFREEKRKYGDAFEPVLHAFWTRDTRDSYRIPTTGYRANIFGDVAPGGDNQYWRFGANYRHYVTVIKRYHHVLMWNARFETIDDFSGGVPIYNRLFLGGPKSVRGVQYRHVSPMVRRDGSRHSYDPWGGQTLLCGNLEYTIPIVKMLRLAIFTDYGTVTEDVFDFEFTESYAWTVGAGLRLDIPMFPIRLDFATPLKKPDHAERELFSFTVGYDF